MELTKEELISAKIRIYLTDNKNSKQCLDLIKINRIISFLPQIEFLTYSDLIKRDDVNKCCGSKLTPRLEINNKVFKKKEAINAILKIRSVFKD